MKAPERSVDIKIILNSNQIKRELLFWTDSSTTSMSLLSRFSLPFEHCAPRVSRQAKSTTTSSACKNNFVLNTRQARSIIAFVATTLWLRWFVTAKRVRGKRFCAAVCTRLNGAIYCRTVVGRVLVRNIIRTRRRDHEWPNPPTTKFRGWMAWPVLGMIW